MTMMILHLLSFNFVSRSLIKVLKHKLSFDTHNSSTESVLLFFPFLKWRNGDSEKYSNLPKVTQPGYKFIFACSESL